ARRPPSISAISASVWFHASAWPPGNHGTIPEGSCHSAIASTVSRSWSAVTIPSMSTSWWSDGTRSDRGTVRLPARGAAVAAGRAALLGPRRGLPPRRGRARLGGLVGVHHEALAQYRVEQPLRGARQRRSLRDVPHEQPVVRPHRGVHVVGRPDQALP